MSAKCQKQTHALRHPTVTGPRLLTDNPSKGGRPRERATCDALSKQGRFATIVNRAPERLMSEAFGAIGRVLILAALACVPCRMTRGTCAHRLQHDVGVPPA
jgi:hypothetical protein